MKDGRVKASGPGLRIIDFEFISPLDKKPPKKGAEINAEDVHPFWAMIKCLSAKLVHNMEFVEESFVLPHTLLKGLTKPTLQTTVTLPVLRNIDAIENGDVLTAPYSKDEDDEE